MVNQSGFGWPIHAASALFLVISLLFHDIIPEGAEVAGLSKVFLDGIQALGFWESHSGRVGTRMGLRAPISGALDFGEA